MGLFGGTVQSTVGANKSGAGDKQRFGPDAKWFFPLIAFLLFWVAPLAVVVYLLFVAASQLRKVRASRLALIAMGSTLAAAVIGLVVGGAGQPLRWQTEGLMSLYQMHGLLDKVFTLVRWVAFDVDTPTTQNLSIPAALLRTVPLSVPAGMWLGVAYSAWMQFRRSALNDLEGEEYHVTRPEGVLDRRREKASVAAIRTGHAIDFKRGFIAVGVGEYGKLVSVDIKTFLRPTVVFGGPRQGKTVWTMSVVTQMIALGSGALIIDFKGDGELPAHYACVAAAQGRRFKHFSLRDKNNRAYVRPAASAPNQSAFYDPTRKGNATSKADMLVNSVPREGDAMAYFRAQYEFVQTVFSVAQITGYGQDRGLGGFQTLLELLDLDKLQKVAQDRHPGTGRSALADYPDLQHRVDKYVENLRKDEIQRGAINDAARLLGTYMNGPAAGEHLRPAPEGLKDLNIDLVDAVLNNEIVVFSLSVQDYGDLSRMIGTLVILDMQNAIAELRAQLSEHRQRTGKKDAAPPWESFYVQIEEFGSAGSEAVLGLLNKAGDVDVRPILSSQSWHDIVAVTGTDSFARRVLDQAGNVVAFSINDEQSAEALSGLTEMVTKKYARSSKEFSGGAFGSNLKAANTGEIQPTPVRERAADAGAFQKTGRFEFLWFAKEPKPRIAHSFKSGPGHWYEVLKSVVVPADVLATTGQATTTVTANEPHPAAIGTHGRVDLAKATPEQVTHPPSQHPTRLPGTDHGATQPIPQGHTATQPIPTRRPADAWAADAPASARGFGFAPDELVDDGPAADDDYPDDGSEWLPPTGEETAVAPIVGSSDASDGDAVEVDDPTGRVPVDERHVVTPVDDPDTPTWNF